MDPIYDKRPNNLVYNLSEVRRVKVQEDKTM